MSFYKDRKTPSETLNIESTKCTKRVNTKHFLDLAMTVFLTVFLTCALLETIFCQSLLVPGCPSLSDQDDQESDNKISAAVCYCDNGTDFGGDPNNSVAINCVYPASLGDLASCIKLVRKAQMQVYSVSMYSLIPTKNSNELKEDSYFKNLDSFPSHLSFKSCVNETTKTIVSDTFLVGLEDSLLSLTIYDCPLGEIPLNLKSLKNLERLRLQKTSINEIKSDDLSSFEKLLTLDLQGNNMNKIDVKAFDNLTNLQSLVLGPDNNLDELVFVPLKQLKNLVTLDMSWNKIAKLDQNSFDGLEQLEVLYLNGNQLLTIPNDVFAKLSQLIEVYLTHNLIDNIPDGAFSQLKSLQSLSLKDNFLNGITSKTFDIPNLQTLDLTFNELISLNENVFINLPNLTNLLLRSNRNLRSFDARALNGLSELLSLDISFTNITSFDPDMFLPTPKLTDLNLSHTKISILPKNSFISLKNLTSLNIKDTQLVTIADGMFDGNKNLNKLLVGENLWSCDKNLMYLLKWIQENENNVHVAYEFRVDEIPTCYNPEKLRGLPLRAININQLTE